MIYEFAGFELDSEERLLTRDGNEIALQPKAFAVLETLLERPDRTVSRADFEASVWAGVSVTRDSLHRCIALVRTALGEREGDVSIVRTVRGRGYRMGVPVVCRSAHDEVRVPPAPAAGRSGARGRGLRGALVAAAGVVGLLVWLARPPAPRSSAGESPGFVPSGDLDRVAVLPFRDLSTEARDRHLADGISAEVVHRLATIPSLAVLSTTSSFRYRDAPPEVAARDLHAGILVSGSVRRAGDYLRVRAEVAEAQDGTQLWSGTFEGDSAEMFALEDQIGRAVARVIAVDLPAPAASAERERDVVAYEISLRGRTAAFERERAHQERAVQFYRRALEVDPGDAETYVGLAAAERELSYAVGDDTAEHLENATEAIERALQLAPNDPRALATHGAILMKRREWRRAERSLRRSLELERSADAHLLLGVLLMTTGRLDAARDEVERARSLDPVSPQLERTAGRLHLYRGEFDLAIQRLTRALELRPNDPDTPRLLAEALYRSGNPEQAAEALTAITPDWLRFAFRIDRRVVGAAPSLRHLVLFDVWRTGRRCRNDPLGTALMWAFLEEPDEMYACLELTKPENLHYSWVEPAMRPYRDEPRFRGILRRAGYGPVIDGTLAGDPML